MRGSTDWQVHQVFDSINNIGKSKHGAKVAARAAGAATWHDLGQRLGIHSYATLDQYRDVSQDCLEYAKENFRIRDIEKLTPEAVQGYLESKIDQKVAYATFQQYAAAMEKLAVALNAYSKAHSRGNAYDFSSAINEVRKEAQTSLNRYQKPRAYADPAAIRSHLTGGPAHALAAAIQHESGLRVSEATYIKADQLKSIEKCPLSHNQIWIQGKGGKFYPAQLTHETYQALKAHLEKNGETFAINQDWYRADLKQAAIASNQKYHGSHGLRWSYAQERVEAKQSENQSYNEALRTTSSEMGHTRLDITEHYLR